jgi:hypothetical protein
MLLTFSREGNGLGMSVLFIPGKWLLMPSKGVCVSKSVL